MEGAEFVGVHCKKVGVVKKECTHGFSSLLGDMFLSSRAESHLAPVPRIVML